METPRIYARVLLGLCDGRKRNGKPCRNPAGADGRCWQHPKPLDTSDLPFCLSDAELAEEEEKEEKTNGTT